MISVVLRFYGTRPKGELRERLNHNNEAVIKLEDEISLNSLFEAFQIDTTGKLVRINEHAVFDYDIIISENDIVDIFGLYAGG